MSSTQVPFEQLWPESQLPQVPPHPSLPHCLPLHCFVQQVPVAVQVWLGSQPQSWGQLAQFSPAWQL
jgi:hypothetical protein